MTDRPSVVVEAFQLTVKCLIDEGHMASFRAHYSGRAMYGHSVPAIDTDAGPVMVGIAWSQACSELDISPEDAKRWAPLGTDQMGRGKIYY